MIILHALFVGFFQIYLQNLLSWKNIILLLDGVECIIDGNFSKMSLHFLIDRLRIPWMYYTTLFDLKKNI